MKNDFTKEDLRTGDIVVLRSGEIGIVIRQDDIIVYQNSGSDYLNDFTDDLLSKNYGRDDDIVEVYADAFPSQIIRMMILYLKGRTTDLNEPIMKHF